MTHSHAAVHRRHVYFLSGFDPKGASYYHSLYRTQAGLQSAVSGYQLEVNARQRDHDGTSRWSARFQENDQQCETTIEFARWDDIVRKHWLRSTAALLADTLGMYRYALACGVIPKLWRLARRPVLSWGYPAAFLLGSVILGALTGAAAMAAVSRAGVSLLGSWGAGAAGFLAVLWAASLVERRLNTTWLARIYSFARRQARDELPELERRVDQIALSVVQTARSNAVDEVLVVGFSVGSILAVSVISRALDALKSTRHEGRVPSISLLTLGHCIPMLGLLPEANRFRGELKALSSSESLTWVDCSSPTDWGSFALIDPVSACVQGAVNRVPGLPTMRSPRFHTLFPPMRYLQLRRDKRRMHLQYLMAGETVGDYDYFRLTAGLQILSDSAGVRRPNSP
jgi:hypothetical protein